MNFYFLLEGRSTERHVYRAWVGTAFPQLREARSFAEVTHDHFYMFSANGQPAIFTAIDDAIHDLCDRPIFDHLFICLDAEESTLADKLREVLEVLAASVARHNVAKLAPRLAIHPIVQNCCIETWFLGNADMMAAIPQSEALRSWSQLYNVRSQDPEHMPAPAGYRTRAQFHHDYLREMVNERAPTLRYGKTKPGPVLHPTYLAALVRRHQKAGHIASFGEFVRVWETLGGTFPV